MRETSNSLSKQNSQQPKQFRGGEKKVMKKSLLAFVLAFSLVLSVAVPAFAATPSDVKGTASQTAVEELIALGVINGYEDGTFKPENDITRAEMAKLIVVASGNESAANLMASVKSSFSDVKTTNWANGYINAALAKGFIQGDGNGKFRPQDNVKFEEVVAMLVRSLGYKENQLSGAWPYNYLLAAQDIKPSSLYEGLDITPGVNASRGIVAQLVSNAVNSNLVQYTGLNGDVLIDTVGPKLVTKIGATESAVLSASALNKDKEISLNGVLVKTADNFIVTGGKALADLVGHSVTVVKTKDASKVIAITDAQPADKIVSIKHESTAKTVGYSVYIKDDKGKEYPTVDNTKYLGFQNNFASQVIGSGSLAGGANATLFLNDKGQVQFVSVVTYTENKIVTTYDAKTSFRDARINYQPNGSVTVNDGTVVKLNGVVASASDLKENDVIRFVQSGSSAAVIVEATRDVVTGKIEQVKSEGTKTFYTVAGKSYEDVSGNAALTLNNEYTLLLNKDGKVAGSTAVAANTTSNFAVAVKAPTGPVSIIDNGEVTPAEYTKLELFSVKDNKNVVVYLKAADINGTIVDNSIVKLTYNADGKVTKAVAISPENAANGVQVKEVSTGVITTVSNSTYYVNSNTVYLDATKRADNTISIANADQVNKNDKIAVVLGTNLVNAELVVLVEDSDATNTDTTVYGTYVSKYSVASGNTVSYYVTLNVKGASEPIAITADAYADLAGTLNKYTLVKLTDLVAGKYDTATIAFTAATSLTAVNSTNSTFTTDAGQFIVTPNTVVYSVDKDNNVAIDTFGAINAVVGGDINNTTSSKGFSITVEPTLNVIGGVYKEAAVVIVKTFN